MCRKNEIQFLFRLALNAMKRLWCNANIQMFSAFSSITVNLHSKNFVFNICIFSVLAQSIFSIIAIIVPVHQRNTYIKVRDHQLVCRLHKYFSWLLHGNKRMNNSRMFLTSTEICYCWFCWSYCSFSSVILTLWSIRQLSTHRDLSLKGACSPRVSLDKGLNSDKE